MRVRQSIKRKILPVDLFDFFGSRTLCVIARVWDKAIRAISRFFLTFYVHFFFHSMKVYNSRNTFTDSRRRFSCFLSKM